MDIKSFYAFMDDYKANHMKEHQQAIKETAEIMLQGVVEKEKLNEILIQLSISIFSTSFQSTLKLLELYHNWLVSQMKHNQ